jgi:hypothetical protein
LMECVGGDPRAGTRGRKHLEENQPHHYPSADHSGESSTIHAPASGSLAIGPPSLSNSAWEMLGFAEPGPCPKLPKSGARKAARTQQNPYPSRWSTMPLDHETVVRQSTDITAYRACRRQTVTCSIRNSLSRRRPLPNFACGIRATGHQLRTDHHLRIDSGPPGYRTSFERSGLPT